MRQSFLEEVFVFELVVKDLLHGSDRRRLQVSGGGGRRKIFLDMIKETPQDMQIQSKEHRRNNHRNESRGCFNVDGGDAVIELSEVVVHGERYCERGITKICLEVKHLFKNW